LKREPDRLIAAVQWEKQPEIFAERFVIEGEAGVGGTSIVYRAIDQTSGQTVALKLLRRTGPADLQRFDAEAEALETLRHPAIVRYIAHGVADGHQPYLAMEWVDGETLRLRLERGALDVDEVVMIGRRIADALAAAHASGILHRDIKPSNILLPRRALARAKVADFGLVRAIDIDSDGPKRDVTATGIIVGTPGYMAPEQAHGVRDLDARADLFSLGCLLFRCLTEIDAFEGSRALTALAKLVLLEPPRVAELRPDVPGSLDRLVAALLAKEREQRPASAAEVREKLESIAERMRAAAPHYIESRRDESRRDRKVPASTPGSVFGRYVLEGRLGEGGMGEVFRAHDTTLARAVALKILRGSPDHATSELLVREARAAAVLSHPNIVTIYDVGEQDGVPFLAMECVNGKDLRAHVGDPSAGIDQRVRWLIEAARGLAAAHQAGVVHGDVKPANVMVANDDTVKILDFGLATAVPGCVGTPAYMAPEQIRGEALDGRADQFAWGVTAYELLTGRPPWPREDPLAAFAAILSDQPVVFPPKERDHGAALPNRRLGPGPHDPELPSDVADVILRTLRKRRDERFPNMDALLAALEANVRASVAAMHLPAAPPAPARRGIQRVRAAWLGLVPLAVAVGLVVFGLEIGRTGRGAPSPRASPLASVPPSEPPASTGIAALPISPKCSPEAAALYQRGLRALREATWRRALGLFEKAQRSGRAYGNASNSAGRWPFAKPSASAIASSSMRGHSSSGPTPLARKRRFGSWTKP